MYSVRLPEFIVYDILVQGAKLAAFFDVFVTTTALEEQQYAMQSSQIHLPRIVCLPKLLCCLF